MVMFPFLLGGLVLGFLVLGASLSPDASATAVEETTTTVQICTGSWDPDGGEEQVIELTHCETVEIHVDQFGEPILPLPPPLEVLPLQPGELPG